MRHFQLAVIVLLPFIHGCETSSTNTETKFISSKVINGTTFTNEDPAAKFNIFYQNGNSYCSGSLIAQNLVLTASHCLENAVPENLQVMTGLIVSANYNNPYIKVKNIFKHPGWSAEKDQDNIAILELAEPVDESFKPIALYDGPLPADFAVFPIEVYGYSLRTLSSSSDMADYFRGIKRENYPTLDGRYGIHELNGKLLSAQENPYKGSGENFILLDQISGGICQGDSGGPMVVTIDGEKVQMALNDSVVSIDEHAIDCSSYSSGTYLQPYLKWINETIEAHKLTPVAVKHFAKLEDIHNPESADTSCIYTQGNVTNFLEMAKDNIKNHVCDKKLINNLEEYVTYSETYCTTKLSINYQKSLKVTLESIAADCKDEVQDSANKSNTADLPFHL